MDELTSPRTVEAVTRIDTAIDQLLTGYLLASDRGILTVDQEAAIRTVLDLFDLDALKAIRVATGLSTEPWSYPNSERPRWTVADTMTADQSA